MLRAVVIALLLPGFAVAQDRAPPPPGPDAPAEVLSTAQLAAQDMLQMYEEFCLQRFPGEAAIQEGVAAHHLSVAGAAETSAALLGRAGHAWRAVTPNGTFFIAIEAAPHAGCAVSGPAGDDAGIHAAFELAVRSYAQAHEFGMLTAPPLQNGKVAGQDASVQIFGATPDGRPRQAFVNMQSVAKDGVAQLRLTRELAPK